MRLNEWEARFQQPRGTQQSEGVVRRWPRVHVHGKSLLMHLHFVLMFLEGADCVPLGVSVGVGGVCISGCGCVSVGVGVYQWVWVVCVHVHVIVGSRVHALEAYVYEME